VKGEERRRERRVLSEDVSFPEIGF